MQLSCHSICQHDFIATIIVDHLLNLVELHNNVKPHLINLQRHDTEVVKYSIHAWSSHSASYHPRNIMVNNPNDQSSRWSSGSNNQLQFITLKLDKMAIVRILLSVCCCCPSFVSYGLACYIILHYSV
jgi:hypothetical protein